MAATMNTAQRFARISAVVDSARHMITQNPANAALQEACITSVVNLLKAEPGYYPDSCHMNCARALLNVLPGCEWVILHPGTPDEPGNWVAYDEGVVEHDEDDEDNDAIAPSMQPHDMCDDPC